MWKNLTEGKKQEIAERIFLGFIIVAGIVELVYFILDPFGFLQKLQEVLQSIGPGPDCGSGSFMCI